MKKRFALICGLLSLVVAGGLVYLPAPALAQRGNCSSAVRRPSAVGFTVDLCERNSDNNPSETSVKLNVPTTATARFIVLIECGDPANADDTSKTSNWSDVVQVVNNGEVATAQLFSEGALPSFTDVTAGSHVFLKEIQVGSGMDDTDITTYFDGTDTYNIHSAAGHAPCAAPPAPPAQVPEGDTLMLVGTGLAGLAGYAGLRWRARRGTTLKS